MGLKNNILLSFIAVETAFLSRTNFNALSISLFSFIMLLSYIGINHIESCYK
jgi:hypothetical protein